MLQKSDIPFSFFNKMENKLISITVVREILSTSDMRDWFHTFIATNWSIKNELLEVEGTRAPMAHSWRRQWPGALLLQKKRHASGYESVSRNRTRMHEAFPSVYSILLINIRINYERTEIWLFSPIFYWLAVKIETSLRVSNENMCLFARIRQSSLWDKRYAVAYALS